MLLFASRLYGWIIVGEVLYGSPFSGHIGRAAASFMTPGNILTRLYHLGYW